MGFPTWNRTHLWFLMHKKLWPCLVGKMVRWNHGSLGVFQGFSGFPYTIRWWQKSRLSHVPGLGEAWEREPVWVEFSILLGFSGHVGGWFFEPDFVEVVRDSLGFLLQSFLSRRWVLNFTSQVFSQELKGFFVSHVAVGGWRFVFDAQSAALGGWSLANVNHDKWRPQR